MNLAFISDVHGNLPAFEAVLAEIERRGPFDALYCGGDIVVNGLFPAECVDLIQRFGWLSVRGNADERAVASARRLADDAEVTRGHWTAARLADAQAEFLAGLPRTRTITGPSGQTLMLAHATPWSTSDNILHDDGEQRKRSALDRAGVNAFVYGHIHHAYQQAIGDRVICCLGAVGLPSDGDHRACFAIAADDGDGWGIEHVRVAYDHASYADAIDASDMPDRSAIARRVRAASTSSVSARASIAGE